MVSAKQSIRLSTVVLLTIATFDLVSTILWLRMGQAEGNPLFAFFAKQSLVALVAAKMVYIAIPVALFEYARTRKPLTAEIGTWIAASAYAYLYVGHLVSLNHYLA